MGALISFELARLLRRTRGVVPRQLIVSGRMAPQLQSGRSVTYNLPTTEFLKEIMRINGTPREMLEHAELMEIVAPTLRADSKVGQTYHYLSEPPLPCDITALGEVNDETTSEELEAWKMQTNLTLSLKMLPGDHFIINAERADVLGFIRSKLQDCITGS